MEGEKEARAAVGGEGGGRSPIWAAQGPGARRTETSTGYTEQVATATLLG